jgi:hypothetical protein
VYRSSYSREHPGDAEQYDKLLKIVLVGDSDVGKTGVCIGLSLSRLSLSPSRHTRSQPLSMSLSVNVHVDVCGWRALSLSLPLSVISAVTSLCLKQRSCL